MHGTPTLLFLTALLAPILSLLATLLAPVVLLLAAFLAASLFAAPETTFFVSSLFFLTPGLISGPIVVSSITRSSLSRIAICHMNSPGRSRHPTFAYA